MSSAPGETAAASPGSLPPPRLLALAALAFVLPTLPNAVYFAVGDARQFWAGQWLTSLLLVTMPLFFGATIRASLIGLLPVSIFASVATSYAWTTRLPPSLFTLHIARQATQQEISVFLPQIAFCVLFAAAALALTGWLVCAGFQLRHRLPVAWRIAGGVLLCACLAKDVLRSGPASGSAILLHRLDKMYPAAPFALLVELKTTGVMDRDRVGLLRHRDVTQTPALPGKEICVLVIGEAVRRDALGIYGSGLDTTPLLAARRDLTIFAHAQANATFTDQAIPVLLTGEFPTADDPGLAARLSLIEAFRLAGFRTLWISAQTSDSEAICSANPFAANANEEIFQDVDRGSPHGPGSYDAALLPPLRQALHADAAKLFIVVHLTGSHEPYLNRYPPEFEHWPVEPATKRGMLHWLAPYDDHQREEINHAYWNSLRYTDWVLDRILALVQETHAVASVTYVSDHGENKPDSPVLPAMHGTMTEDVIRVPLVVWLSESLKAARPAQATALAGNSRKRVALDDVFATLCCLHDLQSARIDLAKSLADSRYREHPRRVMGLDGSIQTLSW